MTYAPDFAHAIKWAEKQLLTYGQDVDTGRWQGVATEGKPDLITREVMNLLLDVPINRPQAIEFWKDLLPILAEEIEPNLPWADRHFEERVSRVPSNPGEEYKNWPWWQGQSMQSMTIQDSTVQEIFTHTYQERFWPKQAGPGHYKAFSPARLQGIRYEYGDLDDVVNLLFEEPFTRQATFPIFFPEDTGAVHGGRVPCTLHYHFLLRNNRLYMWYPIRSCDYVRHFRDDLYLACRLLLWVLQELVERELRSDREQIWVDVNPGMLHFTAYSFHIHKGDIHRVQARD